MEYISETQGVWRCVAGSAHRAYVIEQLDRRAKQLQLAIYDSPQIDSQRLVEVIQVKVIQTNTQGIWASGTTQEGQPIRVRAFQRTVDFVVEDATSELASGVCSYLTDWE